MGVFDSTSQADTITPEQQVHTIEIHGQEEKADMVVIARTLVTEEDEHWVTNQLLNAMARSPKRMTPAAQFQLADRYWLERLIVSWTLPHPLEPDRAKAIASLSQADQDYLYQAIMAARPKQKERPLGLGVRGPSPAMRQAMHNRARRFARHAR